MSEILKPFAEKQFNKFAKAYRKLRNIELLFHIYDEEGKNSWDFAGKDTKTGSILYIQYTEGIQNQTQKANLEATTRGEYEFKFAPGMRPYKEAVKEAYIRKLSKADKNFVLMIGFHDFFYSEDDRFDDIKSVPLYMKKEFGNCAFKEVWIINKADSSCNLIFE